jgi:acyl-coenzyme A thioesterase PaaI-like protein
MSSRLLNEGFSLCGQLEGFSSHTGPVFEKCIDGKFYRALDIEKKHLNPEGVVHGGVSLAFADYVIYSAIGDEIGHKIQYATINLAMFPLTVVECETACFH